MLTLDESLYIFVRRPIDLVLLVPHRNCARVLELHNLLDLPCVQGLTRHISIAAPYTNPWLIWPLGLSPYWRILRIRPFWSSPRPSRKPVRIVTGIRRFLYLLQFRPEDMLYMSRSAKIKLRKVEGMRSLDRIALLPH